MTDPIHACHYASQPYVTVLCTQQEHFVWAQQSGLPAGVYRADWDPEATDPGPLYTFDDDLVTCPECLVACKAAAEAHAEGDRE